MVKLLALVLAGMIEANIAKYNCNHRFRDTIIKENLNSPYQMSIDYRTDTLYFSETEEEDENESSRVSYLNLQSGTYDRIPGIAGGFATTVDKNNNIVYLGGKDGIFKYDLNKKTAVYDGAKNISMWQLFFKDVLYFTTFPDEKVYTYEKQNLKKVTQLENTRAMLIGVNIRNDIYFSNSSGLFCYNVLDNKIYELGEYNVNSFSADKEDSLYFSTPNAVYYIDDSERKARKIMSRPNIYGFVLDNNYNLIYAQEENLVRREFTNSTCIKSLKNNT